MTDNNMENTMYFKVNKEDELNPHDVLLTVYQALEEKGYNSRELSQMLKNEGIIIPAYLIKQFFTENGNIPVTQKQEAISTKKQTPQKAAFIVPDTSDKKI